MTRQSPDSARSIRIVTRAHDEASSRAAARELERAFERRGIEVSGLQRMRDVRQGILDHLVIILSILGTAALLVVMVGGIALTSTLTLLVIRRTREIGILGAIGAAPSLIARHVWCEAMVIGVLSWAPPNVLAIPLSYLLETVTGGIFFKAPLAFHLSPAAAAWWLLGVRRARDRSQSHSRPPRGPHRRA
jgi:ABC-type lipoprotein release transport system permease subunit